MLAAIGSAVGLGNMWRFSYLSAENGGAAFVFLYLVLTAGIGLPLLLAELAIGRGSQKSPVRALAHFGGRAWTPLGFVFVAAGFLILSYYSVIAAGPCATRGRPCSRVSTPTSPTASARSRSAGTPSAFTSCSWA